MGNFQSLLSTLSNDQNARGREFEKIAKWYFENDPIWKSKILNVWLWNDYPNKWGRDKGIDLICRFKNGEDWAVQAKCYNQDYSITKKDVDKFLSESNRKNISGRILVATSNKLGHNAIEVMRNQEKQVVKILLYDLENSNFDFPDNINELTQSSRNKNKPRSPHPYQLKAIKDVTSRFKKENKGQLLMPCGTGKTYTSLLIKEKLKSKNTLVLLPSLSLLSQTLHAWTLHSKINFNTLCVCSDETVTKGNYDHAQHLVEDLGFPVTTDAKEIKKFLKSKGDKVIFSTYQSSPQIAIVQKDKQINNFDLVIADEAHRCAGVNSSDFATVLNDEKIRASKKLFMTATPRVFTTETKKKSEERDVEIISMDDEKIFGKVFFEFSFGEAIENKYLTDYRVVIVGVDEPMMKKWIDRRELVKTNTGIKSDAKNLASHIGLIKTSKDFNLKKIISFHSRVHLAKEFSSEQKEIIKWIPKELKHNGEVISDYVSGMMSASERNIKLERLKNIENNEVGLLANARCLSEGVDVPTLDGLIFVDPRRSQIDIIQAVGRAIRLSKNKTHGTIILPVFIDDKEEPEKKLSESSFKYIWNVLNALKSHDNILADELNLLRTNLGRSGNFKGGFSKIVIDLPITVGKKFIDSIKTKIVEVTTKNWMFYYGLLIKYKEENGNCKVPQYFKYEDYNLGGWVSHQRGDIQSISKERKEKLDEIGFIWDSFMDAWNRGYKLLKKYKNENGDCIVPQNFEYSDFNLGLWISAQRQNIQTISIERREKLDKIGFIWDKIEYNWSRGYELLMKYKNENGDCRVPIDYKCGNFNLGLWVSVQRRPEQKITKERKEKLDMIGFVWDPLEYNWNRGYELLMKYKNENEDCRVPINYKCGDFKLGLWVSHKRQNIQTILKERREKLDEIGFIWNTFEDDWNRGYELLKRYKNKNGDCRVPQNYKYEDFNLGSWVSHQRGDIQKITKERKEKLDEIGFIWDPLEDDWNRGYEFLIKYKEENGDCRVPQNYKYEDFNLGSWVSHQRGDIQSISKERKEKLDEIGFIWFPYNDDWNRGYELLKKYKKENGDCRVPTNYKYKDFNLGEWISTQRKANQSISKERKEKLDEIGFVWDEIEFAWNRGYEFLIKYKEENGDCRVPKRYKYDDFKLGSWVSEQRKKKSKNVKREKRKIR